MNDTFISFLIYTVVYWGGFFVGRHFLMKQFSRIMADDTESMIEHLYEIQRIKEQFNDDQTEVIIEHHNNSYFVYNKTTSLFLGQGSSIDEAMEIVTNRFPDRVFFYEETH